VTRETGFYGSFFEKKPPPRIDHIWDVATPFSTLATEKMVDFHSSHLLLIDEVDLVELDFFFSNSASCYFTARTLYIYSAFLRFLTEFLTIFSAKNP